MSREAAWEQTPMVQRLDDSGWQRKWASGSWEEWQGTPLSPEDLYDNIPFIYQSDPEHLWVGDPGGEHADIEVDLGTGIEPDDEKYTYGRMYPNAWLQAGPENPEHGIDVYNGEHPFEAGMKAKEWLEQHHPRPKTSAWGDQSVTNDEGYRFSVGDRVIGLDWVVMTMGTILSFQEDNRVALVRWDEIASDDGSTWRPVNVQDVAISIDRIIPTGRTMPQMTLAAWGEADQFTNRSGEVIKVGQPVTVISDRGDEYRGKVLSINFENATARIYFADQGFGQGDWELNYDWEQIYPDEGEMELWGQWDEKEWKHQSAWGEAPRRYRGASEIVTHKDDPSMMGWVIDTRDTPQGQECYVEWLSVGSGLELETDDTGWYSASDLVLAEHDPHDPQRAMEFEAAWGEPEDPVAPQSPLVAPQAAWWIMNDGTVLIENLNTEYTTGHPPITDDYMAMGIIDPNGEPVVYSWSWKSENGYGAGEEGPIAKGNALRKIKDMLGFSRTAAWGDDSQQPPEQIQLGDFTFSGIHVSENSPWIDLVWKVHPEYRIQAMIFDEPSQYGIDSGRISKLWVQNNRGIVVNYDRGWDIQPSDPMAQRLVDELVSTVDTMGHMFKTASPITSYQWIPLTQFELSGWSQASQRERQSWVNRAVRHNDRAHRLGLSGGVTGRELWALCTKRFENECVYCGRFLAWGTKDATLDHVLPLYLGGNSTIDNIVPACLQCNHELAKWDERNNPSYESEDYAVPHPEFGGPYIQKGDQRVPYEPRNYPRGLLIEHDA